MSQGLAFRGALVVIALAWLSWLACWLGHADPFFRVLVVGWPLAFGAVMVCVWTAFRQRRWWALLAVVPAIWAYAPVVVFASLFVGGR